MPKQIPFRDRPGRQPAEREAAQQALSGPSSTPSARARFADWGAFGSDMKGCARMAATARGELYSFPSKDLLNVADPGDVS
jgi:hypothetical protein